MQRWRTTVHVARSTVKILVTDEEGDEVLRARLPRASNHPRALLTLLEGVALWSGAPVTAVISAAAAARSTCGSELFGAPWAPADSALVRLDVIEGRRQYHLRGLGRFSEVLRIHGKGAAR